MDSSLLKRPPGAFHRSLLCRRQRASTREFSVCVLSAAPVCSDYTSWRQSAEFLVLRDRRPLSTPEQRVQSRLDRAMSPRSARVAFAAQGKVEVIHAELPPAAALVPTPPRSAHPWKSDTETAAPRIQADSDQPLGSPLDTNPRISLTLEMDGVPPSTLTIELRQEDSPNTCRPVSSAKPRNQLLVEPGAETQFGSKLSVVE